MNLSRLVLSLAIAAVLPAAVSAHGVGIQAKLKAGILHVEGFFDDDTPAVNAKVAVKAEDGRTVAEGKTDAKGHWEWPAPPAGNYRVTLDAGDGHLAKATVIIPPSSEVADAVVSEGPTRSDFTGPQKFWMAAVGLAVIAGLTLLVYRVRKTPSAPC